jgi:UDPglucose 6-dehydrogenase
VAEIAVVGAGYVGLTSGACFAHLSHNVVCIDNVEAKVEALRHAQVPIVESDLESLVREGLVEGRLDFSTDLRAGVSSAEFVFLCLPTPDLPNGSVDMSYVDTVARQIGPWLRPGAVVVNKSTVPVGTTRHVANLLGRGDVFVVSNPEFLREGNAVSDFLNPSRVVVGGDDAAAVARVAELYDGTNAPVIMCDATSAETIKYAANAFLATKISFINSIANICEHLGADVRVVADAIGRDPRIGGQFLQPGPGFGGSCFPKDTIGLVRLADEAGYDFGVLKSVIEANDQQLARTVAKVRNAVGGSLGGAKVAVWGLTFKANTDDRRQSPAVEVVRRLLAAGATVTAFDPTVTGCASELPEVGVAPSAIDACQGAQALVVLTEWQDFAAVRADSVREVMAGREVVDARNLLDPETWRDAGFRYQGVGF